MPRSALTPREREVLRVYAETGSCKISAARLGLAPGTVSQHLRHVRARLDVGSTVQAVYVTFGVSDRPG